jgi:hypothetical protein
MTITASRLSDTDFLVDRTVYTFSDSAVADAFQRSIGQHSVDSRSTNLAPMSSRTASDAAPDDLTRGSISSPAPGDTP